LVIAPSEQVGIIDSLQYAYIHRVVSKLLQTRISVTYVEAENRP